MGKSTRTPKKPARRRTTDALKIIDRITGDDAGLRAMIAEATIYAKVVEMLHRASHGSPSQHDESGRS